MCNIIVSAAWLLEHIEDDELRLYDCTTSLQPNDKAGFSAVNGYESYLEAHIKGAVHLDLMGAFSQPSSLSFTRPGDSQLQQAARSAGMNSLSTIVLYANNHPMWATRIWWMLRSAGVKQIAILDGGLSSWRAAGGPVAAGTKSYPKGDIVLTTDPSCWADINEVQAAMGEDGVCTINALSASIHDGTSKHIYGRKGHIPGSLNVPHQSIVDPKTGLFMKPAKWRDAFAPQVPSLQGERVLFYCGSGIAATCGAFALTALGYANIAVYDGSMEEWGQNQDLPLAQSEGA